MQDGTSIGTHQPLLSLVPSVLAEVACRRQHEMPGLAEALQADAMLIGATRCRVHGLFTEDTWQEGPRPLREVLLKAARHHPQRGISGGENVLTTLLHECCHVWAKAKGIQDTTRGKGYRHNKQFVEIAVAIGLDVERDPLIGHRALRLSVRGWTEYRDLLDELEDVLRLAREPPPGEQLPPAAPYVFASCSCQDGLGRKVTICVARDSWHPQVIRCEKCRSVFQ